MKKLFILLLAVALSFYSEALCAQQISSKTITARYEHTPLQKVVNDLEKHFQVKIFFREDWIKEETVTLEIANKSLNEVLSLLLTDTEYAFVKVDPVNFVMLPKGDSITGQETNSIAKGAKNQFDARAKVIGGMRLAPRGQKLTLNGVVTNLKRNEPVIGASVSVNRLGIGVTTDVTGNYKLILEAGKYEISVKGVGLDPVVILVQLNGSGTLDVNMREKAVALNEVQIEAERRDQNVSGAQMGMTRMDIKEMKKMPALLGETDVIKSVQMLPGVTSVGEAAAGFNVRGGNTDQNLILLDDVPVFNPTHLFGFFSIFNPDAVRDATFYRGAIPAQIGGRLSSILDVKQKEGNLQKWQGTGGLGIVSGRFAVEGPVMNGKGSVLAAGRSSYSNWLFKSMPKAHLRDDKASFYDATIKFSGLVSERSKLGLSLYRSHDSFQFDPDTVYSWNTNNLSVTFNHIFSEKLQVNLVGIYGDYDLQLDYLSPFTETNYSNGILQKGLKADFLYQYSKHVIRFGGSSTYYTFNPGVLKPSSSRSLVLPRSLPAEKAVESAIYVNDEIEVNTRFTLNLGLRFSFYQNLGPGAVYQYESNKPRSLNTLIDTVFYANNTLVKPYQGFEPRLALRYSFNEKTSFKASYSGTRQYLHVVSNTLTISPIDVWKPSNEYIKPQIGKQWAMGLFRNWKQNVIETSVEVYYKTIENQLDYKDGAELFMSATLETEVLPVKGEAYGFEFMANKKSGDITGLVSYSYSRTFLQTNGNFDAEKINNNQQYAASYDKPHNLTVALSYNINRRFTFSTNFIYNTGRPITAAVSHYEIDNNIVPFYSARNAYRIPDYHRMDISLTMLTNHRKVKKWESSWNLSIYNVYARKNIYSVFYRYIYGSKPQAYSLSVIGTAVPSLTYNFKF